MRTEKELCRVDRQVVFSIGMDDVSQWGIAIRIIVINQVSVICNQHMGMRER